MVQPLILLLLAGLAGAGELEVGLDWTHQRDAVYPRDASTHRLRGRVGWSGARWGGELVGDAPLRHPVWLPGYSVLPIEFPDQDFLADRWRGEAALTWTPVRGAVVVAGEAELGVSAHLRLGCHLTEVVKYRGRLSDGPPVRDGGSVSAGPLLGLGLEVLPVSWLVVRLQTSGHLRLDGEATRLVGVTTLGLGARI